MAHLCWVAHVSLVPLAASPQGGPREFLRSHGVPDGMARRLVEAGGSAADAAALRDPAVLVGCARQAFGRPGERRLAFAMAPAAARAAVRRLAWASAYPQYRRPDILAEAARRPGSGPELQFLFGEPRTIMEVTDDAVYCVARLAVQGSAAEEMELPAEEVIEPVYLAALRRAARSMEVTGAIDGALSVIAEHERLAALPVEFRPVLALCRHANGEVDVAARLADEMWRSSGGATGSDYWFSLAEVEQRLGRDERRARAWAEGVEAWNRENWGP